MSRSSAKSGKAITTKSLKEKWERSIQSVRENGEKDVGVSTTVTVIKMPDTSKLFYVMTDASLTATGGILMQQDSNRDLHSCAYHSTTFSPAERNYDIYGRELLAVIQALKEWRHYLTGIEHLVTVITDHKHLGYFKQPQNLSQQQAHWALFLQDFDIKWGVEQGINMEPTNTLSRKDEVNTSGDNWETILLEEKDQHHHI